MFCILTTVSLLSPHPGYKSYGDHKAKPIVDTQKIKKNESQHTTKEVTKPQRKRTREESKREPPQKQRQKTMNKMAISMNMFKWQ